MRKLEVLRSGLDHSVNFVEERLAGFLESRYVRKTDDYFICYLSSQTGCNRGCKFCHLTATGQTRFDDSDFSNFDSQAEAVFRHYRTQKPAKYVHFNFMARGEPLASDVMLEYADDILWMLGEVARAHDLGAKFNVSTIMPLTLRQSLVDTFRVIHPTIYYSMYSADDAFRKKWMPGAMPVDDALRQLKEYQDRTKKAVKIHYAFIRDENDSMKDMVGVVSKLLDHKLRAEFNLVRYNPASTAQGEESDWPTIQRNIAFLKRHLDGKVQIIPRVGFDVKASCGMFSGPNQTVTT